MSSAVGDDCNCGALDVFADGCGLCRWSWGAVVDDVAATLLGGDLEEFDQQTVGSGDHGEPSSGHRGDVGDITTACPEPVDQCVQIFDEKTDVVEQVSIMSGRVLRFEEMDPSGADPEEDVAITVDAVVEDHLGVEMCGEEVTESSDVGGDEVDVVEIDPDIRAAALVLGIGDHRDSSSGRAGRFAGLSTAAFMRMSITTTASALRSSNCSPSAAFSPARPRTAVQNPRVMAPGVAPTGQPALMEVATMADSPARESSADVLRTMSCSRGVRRARSMASANIMTGPDPGPSRQEVSERACDSGVSLSRDRSSARLAVRSIAQRAASTNRASLPPKWCVI